MKSLIASLKAKLEGDVKALKGGEYGFAGNLPASAVILTIFILISTEQRKVALKKVSEELDEAEEIIAQMEVELPSMPVSIRQNYQQKLASSKTGLERVKKTLASHFRSIVHHLN